MKEPKTIVIIAKKPNGETATLEIFYEPTKRGYVVKNVRACNVHTPGARRGEGYWKR